MEVQTNWYRITIAVLLLPTVAVGQHLGSARGIGLGAYTASAADLSSLEWNPAGLVYVRDWQISVTNFLGLRRGTGDNGLIVHNAGLAKEFLRSRVLGIRYAPGAVSEFIIPSIFTVIDSKSNLQVKVDKKITFAEHYALGYAYRLNEHLAIGVSTRYRDEEIVDTKFYAIRDTLSYISSSTTTSKANSWNVDVGLSWKRGSRWRLGLVAKNLFKILDQV